jgi:two-component system, OmpR family, sensor kinase
MSVGILDVAEVWLGDEKTLAGVCGPECERIMWNMARRLRSFYWRIGISLVVFVIVVLTAQSLMFSYMMSRPNGALRGRSPSNLAAIVAADISSTLTHNPSVDLGEYLNREYALLQPIYVVMRDGRIPANRSEPLPDGMRSSVEAILAGTDFRRLGMEPAMGGPAIAMAPIQVATELRGIVVLPPAPQTTTNLIARDVGRLLSLPGVGMLIMVTALAAALIFEPARRRLEALERATRSLGRGDLSARAPEGGNDEIAYLAAAFNKMASDLAEREEALRTSDRLRRLMLADVSHELKTPLTAMRGYVETLRMSDVGLDSATRERYFTTLERETTRLDRIIKDLLDLARLENGVGALDVRLFAMDRVFEHVAHRHEHEAKNQRVDIRAHVDDLADQVTADPERIEQVVENLVANALRHTPPDGTVELSATTNGSAIVVTVADSGSGIPGEHLPFVFDRFYKVDSARANGSEGSGLGLSISKAIVERHGGTMTVTSKPGRTAFTFTLPQTRQPQSTSANL